MALLHPTFCWTERYSVNIAVLDRQHQALFDTINELKDALTGGHGATVLDEVLKELFDYASAHFATEEKLMTEHAFPGLERHRAEHQRFARTIEKFLEDYKAGKTGVPVEIMLFLQSWLQEHLLKTDKAYSAYLNARGVR
jgi:hemerythrin-like metal-binding protein